MWRRMLKRFVNDELKLIWNEVAVDYFNVLCQHLHETTKKEMKYLSQGRHL